MVTPKPDGHAKVHRPVQSPIVFCRYGHQSSMVTEKHYGDVTGNVILAIQKQQDGSICLDDQQKSF